MIFVCLFFQPSYFPCHLKYLVSFQETTLTYKPYTYKYAISHYSQTHDTTQHKMDHKKKKRNQSLKVVYISSPMKVRTSASRFRALVQQLTGKNSDIAPYMDSDGGALDYCDHDGTLLPDRPPPSLSNSDTSDSLQGAVDDVFASQFSRIFSPEMADVLGTYHDLII